MIRIAFLILLATNLMAQTDSLKQGTFKIEKKSYFVATPEGFSIQVDQPAMFSGGEDAFQLWMKENLKIPDSLKSSGIQGTVYISFVIDEIGRVTNVTLLKGIGDPYNTIALRTIEYMPLWQPALLDGKGVKARYSIPVKFRLN